MRFKIFDVGTVAFCLMLAGALVGGTVWAWPFSNAQPQMTPEQAMQLIQALRSGQQQAATPAVTTAPVTTITEDELVAQLNRYPKTSGIQFEEVQGGFRYNGQTFLDAEGSIINYRYNTWTGDVTYVLDMADGTRKIKFIRPAPDATPTLLATMRQGSGGWQVTTVTGKIFSGDKVLSTSRGFFVARDNALFIYTPGAASKIVTPPVGFQPAAMQSGDVASTGFVLLERIDEEKGSVSKFFSATKSLGAHFGIGRKEDYALFNINNGQSYPLNISLENKTVSVASGCNDTGKTHIDGLVHMVKCDHHDSIESLFRQDGSRNAGHYYWSVQWFQGKQGPIAVVLLNGLSKLEGIDLTTGKRVLLAKTPVVEMWFTASQAPDGIVKVETFLGALHSKTLADVEQEIANRQDEAAGAAVDDTGNADPSTSNTSTNGSPSVN